MNHKVIIHVFFSNGSLCNFAVYLDHFTLKRRCFWEELVNVIVINHVVAQTGVNQKSKRSHYNKNTCEEGSFAVHVAILFQARSDVQSNKRTQITFGSVQRGNDSTVRIHFHIVQIRSASSITIIRKSILEREFFFLNSRLLKCEHFFPVSNLKNDVVRRSHRRNFYS